MGVNRLCLFPRGPETDAVLPRKYQGLGVDAERVAELAERRAFELAPPVENYFGRRITLGFGDKYWACPAPTNEHTGIDFGGGGIARATARCPFTEALVVSAHYHYTYGHAVFLVLVAPDPAEDIFVRYFHLANRLVTQGDRVGVGAAIGAGSPAKFNHIHFELLHARRDRPWWPWAINPAAFADENWKGWIS